MASASAVEQADLRDHLIALVTNRILDPLSVLLESDEAPRPLRDPVHRHAEQWAARLLGPDDRQAAHAAARLLAALYPGGAAFDPPDHWWRTPLGRVVARRVGHPGREHLSYADAAAMLGITRQGAYDLVRRDKLQRHPDGGVDPASVRDRLNRLAESALSKESHA